MSIEALTDTILNQMPKMPKRSRIFFLHLMKLLLSLRGRFNFANLARYGIFSEATIATTLLKLLISWPSINTLLPANAPGTGLSLLIQATCPGVEI